MKSGFKNYFPEATTPNFPQEYQNYTSVTSAHLEPFQDSCCLTSNRGRVSSSTIHMGTSRPFSNFISLGIAFAIFSKLCYALNIAVAKHGSALSMASVLSSVTGARVLTWQGARSFAVFTKKKLGPLGVGSVLLLTTLKYLVYYCIVAVQDGRLQFVLYVLQPSSPGTAFSDFQHMMESKAEAHLSKVAPSKKMQLGSHVSFYRHERRK